ncbi:MAG: 50S ribosomal protein L6 [bacterium]|nr:50S ribosomal protein L6 [bacterium]
MSRIGKKEITVPTSVKVDIGDKVVASNGKQSMEVAIPEKIKVNLADNIITVTRDSEDNQTKSLHGLTRSLLANAIHGFENPFKKELQIKGIGYKAAVKGKKLILNVGYSHPVELEIPTHITVKIDGSKGTELVISGVDNMVVGEFAAEIRDVRPPEPYKGTGIMYAGERIIRKAGKSAGK